jgi:hypothetical protein
MGTLIETVGFRALLVAFPKTGSPGLPMTSALMMCSRAWRSSPSIVCCSTSASARELIAPPTGWLFPQAGRSAAADANLSGGDLVVRNGRRSAHPHRGRLRQHPWVKSLLAARILA